MVYDLINADTSVWNLGLIEFLFNSSDREAILKIPLVPEGSPDAQV